MVLGQGKPFVYKWVKVFFLGGGSLSREYYSELDMTLRIIN